MCVDIVVIVRLVFEGMTQQKMQTSSRREVDSFVGVQVNGQRSVVFKTYQKQVSHGRSTKGYLQTARKRRDAAAAAAAAQVKDWQTEDGSMAQVAKSRGFCENEGEKKQCSMQCNCQPGGKPLTC